MQILNEIHSKKVYDTTCRALLERHKLLFSLNMTIAVDNIHKQRRNEFLFLLDPDHYGSNLNKLSLSMEEEEKDRAQNTNRHQRRHSLIDREGTDSESTPNRIENGMSEWLPDASWERLLTLQNGVGLKGAFRDICNSMKQNGRLWRQWYTDALPETARFPGDWDNKLDELQRLLIVRCLRPDRVVFAIKQFVTNRLGAEFVSTDTLNPSAPTSISGLSTIGGVGHAESAMVNNLEGIWADSSCLQPIILLLPDRRENSTSFDAMKQILNLATSKGVELQSLSLGAGQDKAASIMLSNGMKHGNWVSDYVAGFCEEFVSMLQDVA